MKIVQYTEIFISEMLNTKIQCSVFLHDNFEKLHITSCRMMCVLHVGMKQISFVLVLLQIYVATGLSCPLDSSSRLPDTPCCWPAGINIPFLLPSGTLALFSSVQHSRKRVFLLTLQCCIS